MIADVAVSSSGQMVAVVLGTVLCVCGGALLLNLGRCAERLVGWHDHSRVATPRWIRNGPSTWRLDAAGFRIMGGLVLVFGAALITIVVFVDALNSAFLHGRFPANLRVRDAPIACQAASS